LPIRRRRFVLKSVNNNYTARLAAAVDAVETARRRQRRNQLVAAGDLLLNIYIYICTDTLCIRNAHDENRDRTDRTRIIIIIIKRDRARAYDNIL